MKRFIPWLWGEPLGRIVAFKCWWPSIDRSCSDWRDWGIAWPCVLVDYKGRRETTTPIWSWIWLRNRLGFPYKHDDSGAM